MAIRASVILGDPTRNQLVTRTIETPHARSDDVRFVDDTMLVQSIDRGAAPRRSPQRSSCDVDITRWLGVRWYGQPYVLRRITLFPPIGRAWPRWRPLGIPTPFYIEDAPGCGCIVKLKALADGLKRTAIAVWRA